MEKQFNDVLKGIRTMMTTVLQSIRRAEAMNENTVTTFRQKLRVEILEFKRAFVVIRRNMPEIHALEVFTHHMLDELLEIMGSPHPELARAGFYVSPHKPTDPVYFWAYQDLCKLGEWLQESCSRDVSKSAFLPQSLQEMVRSEFNELPAVADSLRQKGLSADLIKTLLHPFDRFQKPEPPDLLHRDLVNLRRLRDAILERCKMPDDKIEQALHALFYEVNVNTKETVTYCKAHLQQKLDNAASDHAQLEVLALEEKFIRQVTIESNAMGFDPYRDWLLADEMLKYIKAHDDCRATLAAQSIPADIEAPDIPLGTSPHVKISVTNEQHAAFSHALEGIGYVAGLHKHIIALACRLVLSNKNRKISEGAFYRNYHTPTVSGANGAFDIAMRLVMWIQRVWRKYDVPNLEDMNPHDLKKFILSYK